MHATRHPDRTDRIPYRDIRSHAAFITELVSAASAQRWKMRIVTALRLLAEQAERWPRAEDPGLEDMDLREATMGRRPHVYRILYDFDADRIIVHRIRHAAQNSIDGDDL